MKKLLFFLLLSLLHQALFASPLKSTFFPANHPAIQYIGRVDFSNPIKPRFWASGAYLIFRFNGTSCILEINDEVIYGMVHNYLEIQLDNQPAFRLQLKEKMNKIDLGAYLTRGGAHTVLICKNTEAENGYLEMLGVQCEKLLPPPALPVRKMEFIGDSITCGFGADESLMKCSDKNAQWYDQHSAYLAYGPTTARSLNAQYHLSSVSGIGLVHSCCDKKMVMPQVYDKVSMAKNEIPWDFSRYQPDVVTVCLGQNDGIQDSTLFCTAYVNFALRLRGYYPKARLIFLSSPMADKTLKAALMKYITAVQAELLKRGERNTGAYFFTKRSVSGCSSHPSQAEQKEIAAELTAYLKKTLKW